MERRNTKQRQIILDAVNSRCDHPSAQQIYDQVHAQDEKISLGTVYRNLDILAKEGQILDLKTNGADRYDLRTDEHAHFVCEKCGRVFDLEYKRGTISLSGLSDFEIHTQQVFFTGICKECSDK